MYHTGNREPEQKTKDPTFEHNHGMGCLDAAQFPTVQQVVTGIYEERDEAQIKLGDEWIIHIILVWEEDPFEEKQQGYPDDSQQNPKDGSNSLIDFI